MATKLEFVRGDGNTHTLSIPTANWTPGGKVFFAAKPAIDDDNTDANSVINGQWDDSVVTNITINNVPYKRYICYFPPSATANLISGGAAKADYKGEFEYVPLSGVPVTIPYNNKKLDAVVYFDVKRKTT